VENKPTVLIVDDEPIACNMMEGFLFKDGYTMISVASGAETLTQVETQAPDIILLDIMMPEMDGLEVCRQLKGDKRWQHIPIILVTALGGVEDLARGLDAGADEFLHKPIDALELRARVRSLLRIKAQYDELETMLRLREELTHMIVHDIRTPLTAILGFTELLLTRRSLIPVDTKDVYAIQMQTYRLNSFLNDMLILAKLESDRLILNRSMVNVNQLVLQIRDSYEVMARSKRVKLVIDLPPTAQPALLDANLFQRVLDNLLSNALKFSNAESTVILQIDYPQAKTLLPASVPRVRVKVIDQGPGIDEAYRERIFDKFEIVKMEENGDHQVGLGLAFCKMVVEAHGGRIFVEPNHPTGSVFTVEI
jgi:two-component system, sensor histidine kinase and response regulator